MSARGDWRKGAHLVRVRRLLRIIMLNTLAHSLCLQTVVILSIITPATRLYCRHFECTLLNMRNDYFRLAPVMASSYFADLRLSSLCELGYKEVVVKYESSFRLLNAASMADFFWRKEAGSPRINQYWTASKLRFPDRALLWCQHGLIHSVTGGDAQAQNCIIFCVSKRPYSSPHRIGWFWKRCIRYSTHIVQLHFFHQRMRTLN